MSDSTYSPTYDDTPRSLALPRVDGKLISTALIAGAFATIGFDLFGQTISPLMKSIASPYLGAKLAPVALANQSLAVLLDVKAGFISRLGLGHGLHVLTGLLFYPLAYMLIARPISNAVMRLPWWVTGAAYGAVLFVFALYIMAHLVAGNPPFLGWGGITWVALWGHMVFGIIVAGFHHYRHER
ncbi:MAG: hypothetical protein AAFO61_12430 [Pseudomonadota bacterium]